MSPASFTVSSQNRWRVWVCALVMLCCAGLALPPAEQAMNARREARAADAVVQLARVTAASGGLVHAVQLERGRSLIFENDPSPATEAALRQVRRNVDSAVRSWEGQAGRAAPRAGNRLTAAVRGQLRGLATERGAVSTRDGIPAQHSAWFTQLIGRLIAVARNAGSRVELAGIPYARLYVSLLVATEQFGEERVGITGLLQAGTVNSRDAALDVTARRAVRRQGLQVFAALSTPAEARALAKIATQPAATFVAATEQAIIDQDAAQLDGLSAATWFDQATELLNQYNGLLVAHQAQVQARADRAAATAHSAVRWATAFAAGVLIAALALAVGLMLLARRRLGASTRRSVQQAQDDASRLDAVLSTASDAILWLSPTADIERANAASEEVFGYAPAELIGKSAFQLIPPAARADYELDKKYYADGGERFIGRPRETIGLRKDGTQFPLEVLTTRRTIAGKLLTTSIIRDITERQRVLDELTARELELSARNDALARSNAELQQFAYVASHDLQEPLRKVTSYVEVLEADYGGQLDDQARDYMRRASKAAQRMRQLINDLLELSRIREEGMHIGECDTRAVVDAIVDDFDVVLSDAGGTVQVGDLPFIPGDQTHLHQVFNNLISNAVKYRGEAALLVQVSAQEVPEGWQFSVQDNGIGFPQEYAGQIFGMFKRLVSRGQYEGTGIGLAIVEKIIANHGGRIWATSEPGLGTTISFLLPLRRVAAAVPAQRPAADHDKVSP